MRSTVTQYLLTIVANGILAVAEAH